MAPAPSRAVLLLRVEQVGSDVQVTGSGSANTAALTAGNTSTTFTNVFTQVQIYAGPAAFADGNVTFWSGLSGPLLFGSDSLVTELPFSGSGDLFGILANNGNSISQLVLPAVYGSGSSLSGSSTYSGITLAQLGLSPGQVVTWTWGSGGTADSLRLEVAGVPAPLPIAGASCFFACASRLRRRTRGLTG